jgi:hypothetical protein
MARFVRLQSQLEVATRNVRWLARLKEMAMGHAVHIHSREQYIAALDVLDYLEGTWRGIGPSSAPVLLLTDKQYTALVKAGVVTPNGNEVKGRGKKANAKKTKS